MGTSRGCSAARVKRGTPKRRGTSRSRCATSIIHVSARSTAGCGKTNRYANHSGDAAQPPRPAVVFERGAGAFHQVPERHRRRAGGLAGPALHALVHGVKERHVDRGRAGLDRAHCCDPAARRRDLESGDAVRRAVREAQPACDARDELVVVESEG